MASVFGHALTAVAIGSSYPDNIRKLKFLVLGACCAILPDADVISFKLDIPYEAFWGHRGFTHSLLFTVIVGVVVTLLFFRKGLTPVRATAHILFFTLCTASHSILDAMTSGGLGVAFFSPWDNTRYFFPWRPIKVSPIGIQNFFSEWGIRVILSEVIWIGVPCTIFMLFNWVRRKQQIGTKA